MLQVQILMGFRLIEIEHRYTFFPFNPIAKPVALQKSMKPPLKVIMVENEEWKIKLEKQKNP